MTSSVTTTNTCLNKALVHISRQAFKAYNNKINHLLLSTIVAFSLIKEAVYSH